MDETMIQNELEEEEKENSEELSKEPDDDGEALLGELEASEEAVAEETDGIQESEADATAKIEELRAQRLLLEGEIASLEGELEKRRAETDKAAREYAEFRALYPDADTEALPDDVLASVEDGIPLAAAYALYEKRMQKRSADIAAHNKSTRQVSFGSVGKSPESDYFTPDEVRAMSQGEVKANYSKILQSMKNWH